MARQCSNIDIFFLEHLYILPSAYYEGMELEEICLSAKYQPSSGHCYIEHSIVQKLVLVN
jgi:hypothetical protein